MNVECYRTFVDMAIRGPLPIETRVWTLCDAIYELCDEVESARREARLWRKRATKLNGGVEDPMWFTEV